MVLKLYFCEVRMSLASVYFTCFIIEFLLLIVGKKMLVPLTASLYVSGTLDDSDKVLVDVGTGYFIEVS